MALAYSKRRKRLRALLYSFLALFVLGFIVLFFIKGWLLGYFVQKAQAKLKNKYDITLSIQSYALHGWTEVQMKGISCINANKDTLASVKQLNAVVKIWPLISGSIRLQHIDAEDGLLDVNLAMKIKGKSKKDTVERDSSSFQKAHRYLKALKTVADIVPDDISLKNLRFKFLDSTDNLLFLLKNMDYHDTRLKSHMVLQMGKNFQDWHADGSFNKNDLKTHVKVSTPDSFYYSLHFVKKLAKADIGFHGFTFDLNNIDDNNQQISVQGAVYGDKFFLFSPKVSTDTIWVGKGGISYAFMINANKIVMDQAMLTVNDLNASMDLEYVYKAPKLARGHFNLPNIAAQTFINSLPEGTFKSFKGMQIEGELAYKLDFYVDLTTFDSVTVNSGLSGNGLKINKYGEEDFRKLNSSFTYIPYNSSRHIVVGQENPDFTPLPNISPYLVNAVLSMEDPGFRYHKGFVPEAFDNALKENLQKSEFKRGGSTISQQLVKNVFLSHRKTLDRKAEEALIVWMIENMHLSNKNRMLEVYLNVIEWGPNIYGIKEATHFYFNKEPMDLSLSEAIYLAHIVRSPLKFMYYFDGEGKLRTFAQQKERATAVTMSKRKLVTEEEFGSFWPEVTVTGPALKFIKKTPVDSAAQVPIDAQQDNW